MDRIKPAEAAEFLKAMEARKYPPQAVEPMPGRFRHFATEADRQQHLEYVEKHRNEMPF